MRKQHTIFTSSTMVSKWQAPPCFSMMDLINPKKVKKRKGESFYACLIAMKS